MATKEEILEGVKEVLVDSLAVDDDEVTLEATLVDDLGAESIDFLEIVFNLEKKFDVKIDAGDLMPKDVFEKAEFVADGKMTPAGIEELQKRLPQANLDNFKKNPMVQNLSKILTVNDLCYVVEQNLAK